MSAKISSILDVLNIKLKKSLLQSMSKNYIKEFLEKEKNIDSDILEIHNRPNYIKYLDSIRNKKKLFCIFIMIHYQ